MFFFFFSVPRALDAIRFASPLKRNSGRNAPVRKLSAGRSTEYRNREH